jgi:hypothetical protein
MSRKYINLCGETDIKLKMASNGENGGNSKCQFSFLDYLKGRGRSDSELNRKKFQEPSVSTVLNREQLSFRIKSASSC